LRFGLIFIGELLLLLRFPREDFIRFVLVFVRDRFSSSLSEYSEVPKVSCLRCLLRCCDWFVDTMHLHLSPSSSQFYWFSPFRRLLLLRHVYSYQAQLDNMKASFFPFRTPSPMAKWAPALERTSPHPLGLPLFPHPQVTLLQIDSNELAAK